MSDNSSYRMVNRVVRNVTARHLEDKLPSNG